MKSSRFVHPPSFLIYHTPDSCFIGQATHAHSDHEIWLLPHWGRVGADFTPGKQARSFDPRTGDNPSIIKSLDGGLGWQEHTLLDSLQWTVDGMSADGGVSLLRTRSGRLVYAAHRAASRLAASGSHGRPVVAHSDDGGKSWSPMRILPGEETECYIMNQRLVQLASGRLLLPVCVSDREAFDDGKYAEGVHPTGARFYCSDDDGTTWRLTDHWLRGGSKWRGVQEPCVAEAGAHGAVCLFRSGSGCHQFSHSSDQGLTWSAPQSTNLRTACTPFTLAPLPDGRLFIAYNPGEPVEEESYFPRDTLAWSTSSDGGATWSEPVLIDHHPQRQLIYPSITPTARGLLVVYASVIGDNTWRPKTAAERLLGGGKFCILDGFH